MIISLMALFATVTDAAKAERRPQAEATVRIVRGHEISLKSWNLKSQPRQRELLKREIEGHTILLRLTEFE